MAQADINAFRKEVYEKKHVLPSHKEMSDLLNAEKSYDRGGLLITFCSDEIKTFLGSDVPEDIFVGVNSPIDDAFLISQRICNYLRQGKK